MNLLVAGKAVMIASWIVYCAMLTSIAILIQARRKVDPQLDAGRKSAPGAKYGMLLEALGFLCASLPRTPDEPVPQSLQIAALVLAPLSLLLGWLAIREMVLQWRLQAVVTQSHRLITTGPYAFIRHPVHTSLFGMLLATGFVVADWMTTVAAVVLYLCGTEIRIAAEEKLLAERFGTDFAVYRANVPAYIPFVR